MAAPERTRRSSPALTLRQKALRALARREYSRADLARKLGGGNGGGGRDNDSGGSSNGSASATEIETLLDEFEASGWLSDARFAGGAARQRQGRYSQRYILEELKAKGVTGDTAKDAVSALEQDDYATALALWRQRFGRAPADQKEKARQVRFLQSRGFGLQIVFRVLRDQGVGPGDE